MKTRRPFLIVFLGLSLAFLLFGVQPESVHAATITVNTSLDEQDGSCSDIDCSLRDAIDLAAPGDTIDFDTAMSGQIISLILGQIVIDKDLIIDGSGLAAHVQISGNNAVRVFSISTGVIVTLNQLDIINGLGSDSSGGGIESYGELTLNDCTLSGNSADWGGGIFSAGILSVNRCTVSDNTATGNGGGILNEFGGTLTVNDSTFTGNSGTYGGAIRNQGDMTVYGSVFEDNHAEWGGGIDHYAGELTVDGSTFRRNTALNGGGGITSGDTLTISDCTFEENTAGTGGGIECHNASMLTVQSGAFTGNTAVGVGGGIFNPDGTVEVFSSSFTGNSSAGGGGISNSGTMDVADSSFDDNSSTEGAGIGNAGTMTLTNCTLSNNVATNAGGGIINYNPGTLTVNTSTLSGNMASDALGRASSGYGGGIENNGTLTLNGGDFSGNGALLHGGAIENWGGSLTVIDTGFVLNSAGGSGGAIVNNSAGWLDVTGSLFQDNSADTGGAVYNDNASTAELETATFDSNDAVSSGGGIYNASGEMRVTASTFDGNSAAYGGGIRSDSVLTVTLSVFEANLADFGGGIHNVGAAGTLKVDRSTFSDNTTIHYGAGIYNGATLWVKESTFNGNNAEAGGGIYNDSAATVDNSTFCGNTVSGVGGGIINNSGTLTLNNSTFNGNAAGGGGGIGNSAMLHYRNTIIANSTSGGDCLDTGTIVSNINNLVEDGSCPSWLSGDPALGPLGDNGGPTWTCALQPGSPAIDAGDNVTCLATDQRGYVRPVNGGSGTVTCDIGAFEYQSTPLAVMLASFAVEPQGNHVLVTWEVVSELDNAGFNLYRASAPDGADRALLAFLPAQSPGSTQGAVYSYEDGAVQAVATYWYWLEDIDLSGATTLHGPVSARPQAPTAVTLTGAGAAPESSAAASTALPVAVSGLGGLALAMGGRLSRRQSRLVASRRQGNDLAHE